MTWLARSVCVAMVGAAACGGAGADNTPDAATSDMAALADGARWSTLELSRSAGLGFCPTIGVAASVVVGPGNDGLLYLGGTAFRAAPAGTTDCAGYDYSSGAQVCVTRKTFPDKPLTAAESDRLVSLVANLPPGRCTSDGMFDPCVLTSLSVDGVSDTDWGQGCREAAGPGTHLAGERAIVAFIDSLVPPG